MNKLDVRDEGYKLKTLNRLYAELTYLRAYDGKTLIVQFATETNVMTHFKPSKAVAQIIIDSQITAVQEQIKTLRKEVGLEEREF